MEVLVVTGGIGSGKSEVCRILSDAFSCGVYNADAKVKSLYDTHPTLLADIENRSGRILRDEEGRFLPKKLAEVIFSDRRQLELVESLVFPLLESDFEAWKHEYMDDRFVVFESATILEKPQLKGLGDKVVLVDAPFEVRLERACRRDKASEVSIRARMMNQKLMNAISAGEVVPEVDAVIDNSGKEDELKTNVMNMVRNLFEDIL